MKQTIYTSPGFILEASASSSRTGVSVDLTTIWPKANHPEPHRKLQLNLPKQSYAALASFFQQIAEE